MDKSSRDQDSGNMQLSDRLRVQSSCCLDLYIITVEGRVIACAEKHLEPWTAISSVSEAALEQMKRENIALASRHEHISDTVGALHTLLFQLCVP